MNRKNKDFCILYTWLISSKRSDVVFTGSLTYELEEDKIMLNYQFGIFGTKMTKYDSILFTYPLYSQ